MDQVQPLACFYMALKVRKVCTVFKGLLQEEKEEEEKVRRAEEEHRKEG